MIRQPAGAMLRCIPLLISIALIAVPPVPTWAADARAMCPDAAAPDAFFPQGELYSQRSDLDAFKREWYSQHLRAMGEPSLSCGLRHEEEVYRFLWLRSFHHPIAVRIARTSDGATLDVTELAGAGGYEPGAVGAHDMRRLTNTEWESVLAALATIDFWNMPTNPPFDGTSGRDGAQWIFEGYRAGTYHVVDRWSPKSGVYRDICLKLLALAKHPVSDIY